jgi:hypothetical protein
MQSTAFQGGPFSWYAHRPERSDRGSGRGGRRIIAGPEIIRPILEARDWDHRLNGKQYQPGHQRGNTK